MKKCSFAPLLIVASLLLLVAATNRLGLYQCFLQSNLDGNSLSITNLGSLVLSGTTNQIVFGATNTPPSNQSNVVTWISVQVAGSNDVLRLPLYK